LKPKSKIQKFTFKFAFWQNNKPLGLAFICCLKWDQTN